MFATIIKSEFIAQLKGRLSLTLPANVEVVSQRKRPSWF